MKLESKGWGMEQVVRILGEAVNLSGRTTNFLLLRTLPTHSNKPTKTCLPRGNRPITAELAKVL